MLFRSALLAFAIGGLPDLASIANKTKTSEQELKLMAADSFALLTALPIVLMFIRDAAIVTCFTLSRKQKRPVAAAVFYLALLNFLLPLLFSSLGLKYLAAAAMPFLGLRMSTWFPLLGFAAHAVIALGVLWALWSRAESAPAT